MKKNVTGKFGFWHSEISFIQMEITKSYIGLLQYFIL